MRGSALIWIGLGIALIGVLARFGLLSWFGNLPGDIRIENERSTIFIPITSMIVISIVGSLVLGFIGRFLGE